MRRSWRAGVGAVAVAVALTGCQKVTRGVTSSVSPCFRVLPQAHQAVGGQGSFVDVVRIRGGKVGRFPRLGSSSTVPVTTTTTVTPGTAPTRDVCVVAYRGTFDATRVQHLTGPNRAGRYALVVVSVRTERVRSVVLSDRLPPPLHTH